MRQNFYKTCNFDKQILKEYYSQQSIFPDGSQTNVFWFKLESTNDRYKKTDKIKSR